MKSFPRGEFDFTTSGGKKLTGRICTWSLNRFCDKMNILNVTEMFTSITTGISIRAVAEILLCSVEYTHKGKDFPYTVDDAMDWIDDIGGLLTTTKLIEDALVAKEDKPVKKKATATR